MLCGNVMSHANIMSGLVTKATPIGYINSKYYLYQETESSKTCLIG